eukprot:3257810-Pleurochrysis_carterae.AAC.2
MSHQVRDRLLCRSRPLAFLSTCSCPPPPAPVSFSLKLILRARIRGVLARQTAAGSCWTATVL